MKRSVIPSLDDLRAFDAVVRCGSVRAAAQDLALTHGAVSRRITKLASELQVALFLRDGRGLRLTPAGEKLAQSCGQIFSELEKTLAEIQTPPATSPIVLSCERSLAMRWLIPRLSRFQDANPDLAVHLSVGGGALDFDHDGISLAIRRLDFPTRDNWEIEPILAESTGPVMQPAMRADFSSGDYIGLGSKTRPDAWAQWLAANPETPSPKEIRFLDHHFLMIEAAAGGLGVALCPRIIALDDLARKRIVAPCGFQEDGSHYGLIAPQRPTSSPEIARLKTWIKSSIAVKD